MKNHASPWLVFRTDAGPRVGWGHAMRCIALGQAWQDAGGRVAFLTAMPGPELLHRLQAESFTVHALPAAYPEAADLAISSKLLLSHYPGSWRVLDGYHFDRPYQAGLRAAGGPVLVLADWVDSGGYEADALLNCEPGAERLSYPLPPSAPLMLGLHYFPLRREFLRATPAVETPKLRRRLLVSFGGADPLHLTARALEAIGGLSTEAWEVIVVAGPHARNQAEIAAAVAKSPHPIQVHQAAGDMAALMAQSDLAISAAGGTAWELAFLQVPAILVAVADNQEIGARFLEQQGCALQVSVDNFEKELFAVFKRLANAPEQRQAMGRKGRKLIDGQGAQRVCAVLRPDRVK